MASWAEQNLQKQVAAAAQARHDTGQPKGTAKLTITQYSFMTFSLCHTFTIWPFI